MQGEWGLVGTLRLGGSRLMRGEWGLVGMGRPRRHLSAHPASADDAVMASQQIMRCSRGARNLLMPDQSRTDFEQSPCKMPHQTPTQHIAPCQISPRGDSTFPCMGQASVLAQHAACLTAAILCSLTRGEVGSSLKIPFREMERLE